MVEQPQLQAPSGERSRQRGCWSVFVTQFQGAFSDNLYKFLAIFLGSGKLDFRKIRELAMQFSTAT